MMKNSLTSGDRLLDRFELLNLTTPALELWQARDLHTADNCLITVRISDDKQVAELHRSIKLFQGLGLSSLVPIHELVSDSEWAVLIIEDKEVVPLDTTRSWSHGDLLSCCSKLSRDLESLHGLGIQHGCIEPSHIFCSQKGDLLLLPPLKSSTIPDDVLGLGRLFINLLTGEKAGDDVLEPNSVVELLAGGKPLPALFNQVITGMVSGTTTGMRDVNQRFDEIKRMSKEEPIENTMIDRSRLPEGVSHQTSRLSFPVLTMVIVLVLAFCLLLGIWRVASMNSDKDRKTTVTASLTQEPPSMVAENKIQNTPSPTVPNTLSQTASSNNMARQPLIEPSTPSLQQQKAEAALDEWQKTYRNLERVGGDQWGGDIFERIAMLAKKADDAFLNKKFHEAEGHYRSAAKAAKLLYDGRHDYLTDLIKSGMAAIENKNAAKADQSFRFVLLIDPNNQIAQIGAQRAKTLDEVTETTRKAISMEQTGNLGIARAQYLQAINLDHYHTEAMEGLNRVNAAIEKETYQKLMTDVINRLTAGDLDVAQRSLNDASTIKHNRTEISELRQILDARLTTKKIQELELKAVATEQEHHWQRARHLYIQLLEVNGDIKTGHKGKSRTEMMIRLQSQLAHYLDDPDLLLRNDHRATARLTIEQVQTLSGVSEKTKANATELLKMIEKAEEEIPITLLSDGETEIAIQNVKKLGKLKSYQLSLRPGTYTITGHRVGYRDVRQILKIKSGENATKITVRCIESIF